MILVSVDPGEDMGWCVLDSDGTVLIGGVETIKKTDDFLYRTRVFVAEVLEHSGADRLCVEWPRIYPGRSRKVDPNRIMSLAGRAAAAASTHPVLNFYLPQEWTGRIPKDVRHSRLLLRDDLLVGSVYQGTLKKSHNYLDAVGLGLYCLRDLGLLRRSQR